MIHSGGSWLCLLVVYCNNHQMAPEDSNNDPTRHSRYITANALQTECNILQYMMHTKTQVQRTGVRLVKKTLRG
jgi:hypothetical protein